MNSFKPQIKLVTTLWLCYLFMLLIIDYILLPRPVYLIPFYFIEFIAAFAVLSISIINKKEGKFLKIFQIVVILLLTILPIILSKYMRTSTFIIGNSANSEIILLRNFPLLLLALILLVTEYGFLSTIVFSTVIPIILIILYNGRLVFDNNGLRPFGFLIFIQFVTFMIIGYFINALIHKLKEQNRSLKLANVKLKDYAATREEYAINRERTRMARELHDTLAHSLSALSVQLETAKAYFTIDQKITEEIIDNSLKITRQALQETRESLQILRVSDLEEIGFHKALNKLLKDKIGYRKINLNINICEEHPKFSLTLEQCIYRVVQEGINNIIYHANASNIDLELYYKDGIYLSLHDDGIGFNNKESTKERHFGLNGMEERVLLVGGEISIKSRLGSGTQIDIFIKELI